MMTKMLLALKSEHFFQRKVKRIYLNFPYYDENNLEVILILQSWYGIRCIFSMGKDLYVLNIIII